MSANILVLAGSLRKASYNKQLASLMAELAQQSGANVKLIELNDYPMPLFNEDDEAEHGMPSTTQSLKTLFNQCDGFMIASPEYNGSYSAALKNTIDWLSRKMDNDPGPATFKGKFALICAASPGAMGGIRGLSQLRLLLSGIGVTVLSDQLAVGKANDAFDEKGHLSNPAQEARLTQMIENYVGLIQKLS